MNELMVFKQVSKSFHSGSKKKIITAVSDFSLTIFQGETLGLVGESGCGKSSIARIAAGIYMPDSGELYYNGKQLKLNNYKERRAYAKQVQIIFQDPFASLDPRMTVDMQIIENLLIQTMKREDNHGERVLELLEMVGLSQSCIGRFPHELSGGQLQRICIARALAANPQFLICDEPTSALDVSVQSQIINLLQKLQKQLNLTYLFISHDLNLVRYLSSKIAVMEKGHIVELKESNELFKNPQHIYTQSLLNAIPAFPFPNKIN